MPQQAPPQAPPQVPPPPNPYAQPAAQADPRVPQQGHPHPAAPAAPPAPPTATQGYPLAPPAQAPGHPATPPPPPQPQPQPPHPAGGGQPYAPPAPPAPAFAPGGFAAPPHSAGFQAPSAPPAPSQGQAPGDPAAPGTPPPPAPPTLAKPEPGQAPPAPGSAPAYPPAAYDPAQPAPYDPGAPPPVRRKADASSLTTLLLHLPLFLGSLLVIWLISQLFPSGLDVVFVLAWLASGALVFHRPTERALARLMFKFREPTAAELARLRPVWDEVTRQAGIDGARYDLWVEDSAEINASAAAGHLVSVTRRSLNGLPPEELAAVLAHELGHHVGGHAWSGLLGFWYAVPARCVMTLVRVITLLLFSVASCVAAILTLVILGLTIAFAVTFPPALALLAVPFLLAWAGRRGELRADRFAAEIGYGPQLHAVFTGWQARGDDDGHLRQGLVSRLMSTHPPAHQRIRALEPFVSAPGGPAAPTGGLPS
ncbi:hypothetical protein GCM10010302_19420 [Streptomyces polychromogenes]|uniref:Peptidase M48 domain-containing protein n=1 Tax=Streptomyces polychromogenes TaxID=67342 RepID=A0ABP3EW82_9ACTN